MKSRKKNGEFVNTSAMYKNDREYFFDDFSIEISAYYCEDCAWNKLNNLYPKIFEEEKNNWLLSENDIWFRRNHNVFPKNNTERSIFIHRLDGICHWHYSTTKKHVQVLHNSHIERKTIIFSIRISEPLFDSDERNLKMSDG